MLQPVILSAKVALTATFITLMVGVFFARILTKRDFFGKHALEVLLILPMVLPPTVTGFGLLVLLGKNGLIGKFLLVHFNFRIIFTWIAAVIASFVVSLPIMYQSVKGAFLNVDPTWANAARTLGASESRIFWTITLPLSTPGIVSGLVLSFSRALGEFGATLMVAGNIPGKTQTIPMAIYYAIDQGQQGTVNILVGIVTAFSFILIYSLNFWLRKKSYNANRG